MMNVFTNGYIGKIFRPYPGQINEASIRNELLDTDAWSAFEPDDAFLVDRVFRHSVAKISEKGFTAKIPEFTNTPNASLTTEQANL